MSERIAIFGTGYVGLVTGVCLARVGNTVTCVDIDEDKIKLLQEGKCPIYEPMLQEYLEEMIELGRLSFTTEAQEAVWINDIIMIAVGTPPDEDGSADLQYVLEVATTIGKYINGYKVVVTKSTVPPLTGDKVESAIHSAMKKSSKQTVYEFDVVSNPEFLKEGNAVNDFLKPDRIVIGTDSVRAREIMESLYRPFMRQGYKVIFMDRISAELTKYAANGMLASRISFMNEIAKIAEGYGADIEQIRQGIGSDTRIGKQFLYTGPGYGGSCFPKDVSALARASREVHIDPVLLDAVEAVNKQQRHFFFQKVMQYYNLDVKDKQFAVWGLSFKADTDDVRESPAIVILELLLDCGAKISAYDPEARENFSSQTYPGKHENMSYNDNQYGVLSDADALIILTEWPRFRAPDLMRIRDELTDVVIFDARNLLEPTDVAAQGIKYISIGRKDTFPQ